MHPTRIIAVLLLAIPAAIQAEDASQSALTLQEAVARALENNLDLRIQRNEPLISKEDVVIQKAAFDPQLTASTGAGKTKDPYTGETEATADTSVGVSKKMSTGGTLAIDTNLDHDSTYIPTDSTGLYATFTQPLLKGAWADVTLADLRKAESALTAAKLQTRSVALDLVRDVAEKYWDLSYARENVALSNSAVEAAQKLVDETSAKVKAGFASEMDLLQAKSTLSEKREALTQAKLDLSAAGDALSVLMGNLLEKKGTTYEPEVAHLPTDYSHGAVFEDAWPKILSEDLSTAIQEETIRQADLDRVVADNDRKPQLDLTLKTGIAGGDYNENDAYDSLSDRDGHSWNTTLAFSMPIGNRANVAKARQTRAKLEQAKIQLISTKQTLYKEARQAWRDIELGIDRCNATTAAVEYQSQAFEKARTQYSRGLISFRELLDAQTDYDNAQIDKIDAQRDLAVARAVMGRLNGTLPDMLRLTDTSSIPEAQKPSK
jgi:outer membrane protein TolC